MPCTRRGCGRYPLRASGTPHRRNFHKQILRLHVGLSGIDRKSVLVVFWKCGRDRISVSQGREGGCGSRSACTSSRCKHHAFRTRPAEQAKTSRLPEKFECTSHNCTPQVSASEISVAAQHGRRRCTPPLNASTTYQKEDFRLEEKWNPRHEEIEKEFGEGEHAASAGTGQEHQHGSCSPTPRKSSPRPGNRPLRRPPTLPGQF